MTEREPDYGTLEGVLREALEQASHGKGRERHAHGRDFKEQPIMVIPALLHDDLGTAHLYQAIKKLQESLSLPTPERRRAERLGAINYIAASLLLPGCRVEGRESADDGPQPDDSQVPAESELTRERVARTMGLSVWRQLGGDEQEWRKSNATSPIFAPLGGRKGQ